MTTQATRRTVSVNSPKFGGANSLSFARVGLMAFLCGGAFAEPCIVFTPGTEPNAHVQEFIATDVTLAGDSDFTWEAWVKLGSDTLTENRVMSQTDWQSEGRLVLELRNHSSTGNSNKFVLLYRVSGNNYRTASPSATVPAGKWTHVAVTRSGTVLKIYVNGMVDSVETNYGGPLPTVVSGVAVTVGVGHTFNGALAEVRVWNCARSAGEIKTNYRRRLLGSETGLAGYWPMDEGSGVPVNAVTGASTSIHGYDGTLVKGAMSWTEDDGLLSMDAYIVSGDTARAGASFALAAAIGRFDSRDVTVAVADGYNLNTREPHGFMVRFR